jgi:succinate dehydrogenase / fumarate reductase cytochrome b subunit
MSALYHYIHSSIGRKQIVAVTGLLLILFLIGHLAGNLLIYLGPEAYNAYSKKLVSLRPGLYGIEFGLLAVFVTHIYFITILVWENIKARGTRYAVQRPVGKRSIATMLMSYSGLIVLAFVVTHLIDFTFASHEGLRAIVHGTDWGLYGLVFNTFTDPLKSLWYIIAMCAIALHLSHGVDSFMQTFGLHHTENMRRWSNFFAIAIALLFSSIPVYVLIVSRSM